MANQVKIRRKQLGLTQEKVANRIGTTKATVMKLEKGMMQLTESWLQRLSVPLECRPEDLISEEIPEDVPVVGEIGAAGVLKLHTAFSPLGLAEPNHEAMKGLKRIQRPPEGGYRNIMALEVTSDAYAPFLSPKSYVYYANPEQENIADLAGNMVVCERESGLIQIGRLQLGEGFNQLDLQGLDGSKDRNITLTWAARVIFMKL